jgi:hypothetical protein
MMACMFGCGNQILCVWDIAHQHYHGVIASNFPCTYHATFGTQCRVAHSINEICDAFLDNIFTWGLKICCHHISDAHLKIESIPVNKSSGI